MVDKGNIKYGILYTSLSVAIIIQFALPMYNFMFYSQSVHIFSILISTFSILLNSIIVRGLIKRGFKKLFSSRLSTLIATIVEISFFAYLLNIGIWGAFITLGVRALYLTIIPQFIIQN